MEEKDFEGQQVASEPQPVAPRRPQRPAVPMVARKWCIVCCVACFLVGIGGGVGLHMLLTAFSKEDVAYNMLESNYDPQDFEAFLAQYPESSYAPEVKKRLDALVEMQEAWHRVETSSRVADFVRFKQRYKDARYDFYANQKIDSLDFVSAVAAGTPAALQNYITAHNEGRYIVEAYEELEAAQAKERQREAAARSAVADSLAEEAEEIVNIEETSI